MTHTNNANSAKVVLYGASYSVYVRITQLTLMEKQIEFDLREIDIFDEKGVNEDYLNLNPFGKIPTFCHGDFTLYETNAITRYVEAAFDSPPTLFPSDVKNCARINQIIGILDNYAYQSLVWGVYVEACESDNPDTDKIEVAKGRAKVCLKALEDLCEGNDFLIGHKLSMADVHAAPMFDYFMKSEAGQKTLPGYPKLSNWWSKIQIRPSYILLLGD